jgi:F-type H+-transporting ATPase subunit epsilon
MATTFELPKKIHLEIVTPERSVVSDLVDEVTLPGEEGYLGVLPGHTPLLTSLKIGEIKYRSGSASKYLFVSWGFVEIVPDRVTVLADIAELPQDIDVSAAKAAKDAAEQKLRSPEDDFMAAQIALEQALARMQVAAKAAPLPR